MRDQMIVIDRSAKARARSRSLKEATVGGGTQYTLNYTNNSTNNWYFCCFQQLPGGNPPGLFSLAWFAQQVYPGGTGQYIWTVDYSLLWSQTGVLVPGVRFNTGQIVPADPQSANNIELTYTINGPSGAFHFTTPVPNPPSPPSPPGPFPAGTLYVQGDETIPLQSASVGIGMSGAGTFAVQAQPNITASFTPTPTYWIGCIDDVQESAALNITQFTQITQITFPINAYTANALLSADNEWTVTYE